MTHGRNDITELLARHGLRPSRALGQNFVADANTVRKIARLAHVGEGDLVIEIGAGLGSLTLALADTGAEVVALEVDRHLIEPLREVLGPVGAALVHGDALKVDFATLSENRPFAVVANLPYNVAVPIVVRLLESEPLAERMLVMVQREVGERLVAGPGEEAFGAVSLRVAYFADASLVAKVPASVFVPRPKVESVLVEIVRRASPRIAKEIASEEAIFTLVRRAFSQRRKMLRRSLEGLCDESAFVRADLDSTRRPEELSLEEFARLASVR